MRVSSGLHAGKQAEGTPSETDLSAAGRCTDRILGHLLWALRDRRGTLGPEPWHATLARHPNTTTTTSTSTVTTSTTTSPPPDCL